MSLPVFDPQTHLFGLQAVSSKIFDEADRYGLFARQIYPLLVAARPKLEAGKKLGSGLDIEHYFDGSVESDWLSS